jgi:hypothetical protein
MNTACVGDLAELPPAGPLGTAFDADDRFQNCHHLVDGSRD